MGRLGKWSSDRIEWVNGTMPAMSAKTASVKYMIDVQHTKTVARTVAEPINVGGATSRIAHIWGLIAFYRNSTSAGGTAAGPRGLASVRYGFHGNTVTIPVSVATIGQNCNMLIWGRD